MLALTISHFLNALLGKRETEDKKKKAEGKQAAATAAAAAESNAQSQPARVTVPALTTSAVWETITQVLKEEYNYTLAKEEHASVSRLALLRSLCLKVGLQIAARDYDWAVEQPFSPTDVLDLFPVARSLLPRSQEGSYLLEEGRASLSMGTSLNCLWIFHAYLLRHRPPGRGVPAPHRGARNFPPSLRTYAPRDCRLLCKVRPTLPP